jgi:2-hydroxymuconate-semialdehyde hydrolase
MIHGSGPGASTIGNWRAVLAPLADRFHVYAMDLIGFGKSDRRAEPPYFDIDLWVAQCTALLDVIGAPRIGLLGHSVSGAIALKVAAGDARVAAVLTTGAMGAPFVANEVTARSWSFPKDRSELRAAAEGLVYDASVIDDAYLDNRESVLFQGDYRSYFGAMFAGDKQRFVDAAILSSRELAAVHCPVTMVHGRNDVGFPATSTMTIAESLPQADVILLARCSHSIAMEHPEKLIAAAELLFR